MARTVNSHKTVMIGMGQKGLEQKRLLITVFIEQLVEKSNKRTIIITRDEKCRDLTSFITKRSPVYILIVLFFLLLTINN